MSEPNVFLALGKYSTSEENYLTEAFVFLLNTLLLREHAIGVEILNRLCGANQFCLNGDEDISVSTQEITPQGTPDIKISCPGKLAYVEVKYESDLGVKQIERYIEALKSSGVPTTCLVLLTKFSVDFGENETKPHKHVRWLEVHNWLSVAQIHEAVSKYTIDAFKSFLEEKQMSIQKVSWEYINGVPALINLMNMVEEAIRGARIPFYSSYPRGVALDWRGFYLEKKGEFWCGVYYNEPLVMLFQIIKSKGDFNSKLLQAPTYPVKEDKDFIWLSWRLEDVHFFCLDKDKQLEEITKFVKTAYAEVQQMKVK